MSGEVLVDRFLPYGRSKFLEAMVFFDGRFSKNPQIREMTRINKPHELEGFKHPFCHYYAGLIGSHLKPVHERIGHRRCRAAMRLADHGDHLTLYAFGLAYAFP